MKAYQCHVCGNTINNKEYHFSDLHFQTPGSYEYFQCSACECLQFDRNSNNNNISYYPPNYYSFKTDDGRSINSKIKWFLRNFRNSFYESGKGMIGAFLHKILPCMSVAALYKIKLQKNSNILDVGCGNDVLMLQHLSSKQFTNLTGIDPCISKDSHQIGSIRILKKSIDAIDGKFDLITFNHSFEHMTEQRETLKNCRRILTENGLVLIRIPVVDSFAWKYYKEHWANLDAPRHHFLHSTKSITMLIEQCGFHIKTMFYDSTAFQFWGSNLYKSGFPLGGKRSLIEKAVQIAYRIFYSLTMCKKVERLNSESQGDSIALLIEKKNNLI